MAAKRQYVVRLVILKPVDPCTGSSPTFGLLLEWMRSAGHVVVHVDGQLIRNSTSPHAGNYYKTVFDIKAPHGVDSRYWAEQEALRIQSFGENAVMAPAWTNPFRPSTAKYTQQDADARSQDPLFGRD